MHEMPGITWDINLTTICVLISSCVVFYLTVMRTGDKVKANAATIVDVQEAVEEWKLSHLALRSEHEVLKQELYQHYPTRTEFNNATDKVRAEFNTATDKLFEKIETSRREQLAAINRLDDRFVELIRDRSPNNG